MKVSWLCTTRAASDVKSKRLPCPALSRYAMNNYCIMISLNLSFSHTSPPLSLVFLNPSPFPSRNMYLYLSLSRLISLHHPFLTPYLASVYLTHNSPSLFFVFSFAIYFSHCISLSPFPPLYLSLFHWLFLSYISISHPPCSPSPFSLQHLLLSSLSQSASHWGFYFDAKINVNLVCLE